MSTWERAAWTALHASGVVHFAPREIAPVGRLAHGETGPALQEPPVEVMARALETARVLEWLRSRLGRPIRVTSWYRDPAYNRAVGGARESLHVTGSAADIQVSGVPPRDVRFALEEHPLAPQMGIGVYPSFTHVDLRGTLGRPAPARW